MTDRRIQRVDGTWSVLTRLSNSSIHPSFEGLAHMAPQDGFEPPTRRLTVVCSTPELLGNIHNIYSFARYAAATNSAANIGCEG